MHKNEIRVDECIYSFFYSKGYIIKENYIDSCTPITVKSKDGYLSKISYDDLKLGKVPSFFKIDNFFLEYNLKTLINKRNKCVKYIKYKVINKNKRKRILVSMKCPCGRDFNKTLDDINRKGRSLCCPKCSLKIRASKRRIPITTMIKSIEDYGYKVLDKNIEFKTDDFIEVMNKDGYKGFIKYNYIRQHKNMSIFNENINISNYVYNANIYIARNNMKCKCLGLSSKNNWNRKGLIFECECGKKFETSMASFSNGKFRCDDCSKSISKYEYHVMNFLKENNIDYIKEFKFNDCRDILPLPFDFYLVHENKIIEVDGIQHFQRTLFKDSFDIIKKHDNIKNEYCKRKKIPLLRLSYLDFKSNKYKEDIKQFIEK